MSCGQYTESAAGRIRVVTSGTRPTGVDRYVGQRIFESDTGRELMYDGAGWVIMSEPAQTQTGTIFSGITGGSTTASASYRRQDGYCDFDAVLSFGASPSAISGLQYNLPMSAASSANVAVGSLDDFGVQAYPIVPLWGASAIALWALDASVAAGRIGGVSSFFPFSFGNGDVIRIAGRYRMASRYS